jgi:hypothetical protein
MDIIKHLMVASLESLAAHFFQILDCIMYSAILLHNTQSSAKIHICTQAHMLQFKLEQKKNQNLDFLDKEHAIMQMCSDRIQR